MIPMTHGPDGIKCLKWMQKAMARMEYALCYQTIDVAKDQIDEEYYTHG